MKQTDTERAKLRIMRSITTRVSEKRFGPGNSEKKAQPRKPSMPTLKCLKAQPAE